MASRITRRTFLIATAGGSAATIAAACSGGSESGTGPSGGPASGAAVSGSGSVTRKETLIVSLSDTANQMSDINVVNPYVTGTNRTGWHFAYEPLFLYNVWWTAKVSGPPWDRGKNGEIPYLATGYDYNDDYTAVTIKLRKGVTWSDGEPFTAKDVVFTLNMLRNNAPKLTWSADIALYVKGVDAVDDHTVTITLKEPNPRFMINYLLWHQDLGFPTVPAHIWQGQDPLTFTNFDIARGWPVVTGPWRLTESNPQHKIWDRRDDWWGAKTGFRRLPRMKRVIVEPLFEDQKLIQLFLNNEIDASHNLSPADADVAVARNKKLIIHSNNPIDAGWDDFWTQQICFNCSKPPYNDRDIRWAINHAIDRKQIQQVAFENKVPQTLLPFPTYHAMQRYFDEVKDLLKKYPVGTSDRKKTQQIMQSKGYAKDSGGFWSKGGQRFSMVILIISGFSYHEAMIPVIIAQLRKAGFDASYKAPTNAGTLETSGDAEIWLQGDYANSVTDPYNELATFHSRYSAPNGQTATYPYRWTNKQFDQAIEAMAPLPSSSPKFMSAYRDAMNAWLQDLPVIPTVQNTLICPLNTTYWKGWPDSSNPYMSGAMWHRGEAGVVLNTLEPV